MRIALCLSGLLRDYENYLPRIATFARKWKADVFIHSWSDRYGDGKTPVTQGDFAYISKELNATCFDIEDLSKYKEEFNKAAKWDVKKEDPWSKGGANFAAMFFSIYASNFMRVMWEQIEGQYDLVFRQRFDMAFTEPLELRDLDLKKLNVVPINREDGVADIWAAGNSEMMSGYSHVYQVFDECAEKIKFIRPEDMLKVWLDKNGVELNIVNKSYDIK